ncbi:MAG: CpaF family protein [Actinobacteria bacterium]|nr:CpaF family protein [Actinomycetota bacterium]
MHKIFRYNNTDCGIADYIGKKMADEIDIYDLKNLKPENRIEKIGIVLKDIIENDKIIISEKEIKKLVKEIYEDTFEFGPISSLIGNKDVSEVMINDWNDIYFEENGVIKKTDLKFRNSAHTRNLVERILSPLGLRVDESSPMADARLDDGSRINIVMKPVAVNEIIVTIRKFKKSILSFEDLINLGSLSQNIADFIKICAQSKINIIVSGATSTGKTTFLNIISNFIPGNERIITIEDTLELNLNLEHVIKLESKPPNLEGRGEITIRDLVRNSLRMRPDRIIVGEIRGIEAIDTLQAMNTGHDGSMTTIHANSPEDLISRLETMLLMSGINLNPASARRIISSSIDMIIHLERTSNGKRIVSSISEIMNSSKIFGNTSTLEIKEIFAFQSGDKKYSEFPVFTGRIPGFINKIKNKGLKNVFENISL